MKNTEAKEIQSLRYLGKLSHLQDQIDNLKDEDIAEFYNQNQKINYTTLITLITGSLFARSDNMEIYSDLIKYFYEQKNFKEKHSFRITLVRYIQYFLDKYLSYNILAFCVQLLKKKILFPKDVIKYHQIHFLVEFPEMIEKYPRVRVTFKLLEIPEDNEDPLGEIDKRRLFAYVNTPIANAIRIDDIDTFQRITSFTPEIEIENNFYQKYSSNKKKGENFTSFDLTFNTLPWFDRNETISLDPVTYLQYACFYGAVKCFKFMVANGAQVLQKQESVISTQEFAICGGNVEIIRICEQKGLNFFNDVCLKTAIQFHHFHLAEWIINNMKQDKSDNENEENNNNNEDNNENGNEDNNGENNENENENNNDGSIENNDDDGDGNSPINLNYQSMLNFCATHNAFSILKDFFSNLGVDESTTDFSKIKSEIDFNTAISLIAEQDGSIKQASLDMFDILYAFVNLNEEEDDEDINKIDFSKRFEEEEDENENNFLNSLIQKAKLEKYLIHDTENFIKNILLLECNLGSTLSTLIQAGCQAKPSRIGEYASIAKKVFESINDHNKKEIERSSFVSSITSQLSIISSNFNSNDDGNNFQQNDESQNGQNDEINDKETDENQTIKNDSNNNDNSDLNQDEPATKNQLSNNFYDFRNKNSLIVLTLHLINNEVIHKNEVNYIDCMKPFIEDTEESKNEAKKRIQGMLSNLIANSIINDDVEQLKKLSSQITTDDISFEDRELDWSCIISTAKEVNWLDYSAFYSADKCFSFLLNNFFNTLQFKERCCKFALGGGSQEIVRIIDVEFHYHEVFPIIIQSQTNSIVKPLLDDCPSKFYQIVANYAFYFNNYEVILILIKSCLMERIDLIDVMMFCGTSGNFNVMLNLAASVWNKSIDYKNSESELYDDDQGCNIA